MRTLLPTALAIALLIGSATGLHASRLYGNWLIQDWQVTASAGDLEITVWVVAADAPWWGWLWRNSGPRADLELKRWTKSNQSSTGQLLVRLEPGVLTLSVDGRAFPPMHPDAKDYGAGDALPGDILEALRRSQVLHIEYRMPAEQVTRDISLVRFADAGAASRCLAARAD